MIPMRAFSLMPLSYATGLTKIVMGIISELDLDNNGLLACQESIWVRNTPNYTVNPYGNCSQAGDLLLNQNVTITQYYHGNTAITPTLLKTTGSMYTMAVTQMVH